MKIYNNLAEFKRLDHAVVTIGTYDGVHFGHRKIISRLCDLAKSNGGESVILTFFPHPRLIIDPENQDLKMINTIEEKAEMLEKLGVDHLIITPFTRDFSNLSPDEYIREILVDTIGLKNLIVGYDHRFGKNRSGGMKELLESASKLGFEVEQIDEQDINDVAVSSTKIRESLLNGNVALAATYLGYPFSLYGPVIKGDKIGRTIGFPTANIFIEQAYKLIPSDGIYAVTISMENQNYRGMAYIGQRPTINGMTRNIEVNIFDFDREIYGQYIKMNFMEFLRHDVKFTGLEALKIQLQKDKEDTISYFEKIDNSI
ncbi:bifunctional riboflavin kinase/FAD synthetase [Pedobacter antarcticus]|uniref:Riboflavin biosynthesis protein n=2 Tax=Pedobacter antarcticus TaxID=34086 RepID=A0A081PLP7_9SPHI|nr:bifunctional riboflavin kinase/FAD synthetase [Pedobacter antarcticus]KEQ31620.1 riboflavin biosynthesis protein RibF [Pedobacter antarcticus 4BY]SDM63659.1 riboflavin kinase / FMN adenylyltransferase [Pedobacter antarcticus]SFF35286.1 riboflavin kinase / FMN adenylyltransferase [Pedobacter antarcticus]